MQVLLPGDPLPSSSSSHSSTTLQLGPGLVSHQPRTQDKGKGKGRERDSVAATRAGLLGHVPPQGGAGAAGPGGKEAGREKWWIEGTVKRYTPNPPEPVLGIIIARHAEGYRVDIGSSQAASLDALAFEGATKRNKPNLKIGTLVYAHLLSTPPFSEPEISCVDPTTQKASGFGELKGGMLVRGVELGRCRLLLSPKNPLLSRLGARFPFEVAVGMNGRVWVKASAEEGDEDKLLEVMREIKGQ
ncbi:hypothetical protein JCM8547_008120 [Rhodosporidiobolus lusitaniae]